MIGQQLLNYRVVSQLGSGGLGTVYLGEHTVIGRRAALKVLNPSAARDEDIVARFIVEARAANTIRHPNIVDVTDYGQANGHYVIVMELLEGETLARRLEAVPRLAEHDAIALLVQAAAALSAAHERGIVHRDIKPENLFLTGTPEAPDVLKVLDFGIAKLLDAPAGPTTAPGMILGTPAYMSPEQVTGDPAIDGRSDVYSLGVVAYRLVTGRLPYEGSVMQLLQGHLKGTLVAPRVHEPSLSAEFEQVVLTCLSRAPAQRFQTMKELRRELFALARREPVAAKRVQRSMQAFTDWVKASRHDKQPLWDDLVFPNELEHAATPGPEAAPSPGAKAGSRTAPMPALPRPVDPRAVATMKQDRAERLQAVAVAARLKDIISRRLQANALELPALPEVATKCLQLAHDPDTSFAVLARHLERDPFIASRVVRLSNSPVYGGLSRIRTVEGAVSRLGVKALVGVLQTLAAEQVFTSRDPLIRDEFRGIWEHCLGVGTLARDLCRHLPGLEPGVVYLAGLFHDIGKPVVAALLLELERRAPKDAAVLTSGVWRRVIEECHRELGAVIAYRWFLPLEVAQAIAQLDAYDLKRGRTCANVIRLANGLCQREGLDVKGFDEGRVGSVVLQGRQVLRLSVTQVEGCVTGLTGRVRALTQERREGEGGSTQVLERSVG
ncbi:MAG: HDOD domain-containing protein [Myxococcaceae bacterium]|nr:HDOD domain-containing protein [Myxococcaceae bacterium]MCA3012258.1 HDOD domain-containing protein [Myxococcaceae bacterium]